MNLAELLTIPASMYPDREIVRFAGQGMTYAELECRTAGVAGTLLELGVRPTDRVAVLHTNAPALVEALFATASLGAAFVPLNYRARADELRHVLEVARPRLLLAGNRYLDLCRAAAEAVGTQVIPLEDSAFEQTLDLPLEAAEVEDDALAILMFTSGTTALPKGVMLAHADLTGFVLNTTDPIDDTDRGSVLVAAPLYHMAGLAAVLTGAFAGRRIVLMPQFDAAEWLRLVAQERITHAFLVPTMMKHVLDDPAFGQADLSSLEVLSYGAAPMPLPLIRRAIESFPPTVQFINAFGQTETTSTVTVLGPEDHRLHGSPLEVEQRLRRLASIGRPLPDVEVAILDESGHPLPVGAIGEVAVRTDRAMRGYYDQADATRATLRDGWLHTRDLGWRDEDGYIFLAGRASDLIIRGGENIAPAEVEDVLTSHAAVDEAAVFGVPDEEWGERVAAFVVPRIDASVSAETLAEFCRGRLARFKTPDWIVFGDTIPRNALGKVLRQELRAQFVGSRTAQEVAD